MKQNKSSMIEETLKNVKKLHRTSNTIMLADDLPDQEDLTYVEMPEWWKQATNTRGLPFRKYVIVAGDSDSGKTSCSIASIKAAQEQGITVLYVETEGKTTKQDFINWEVDPKKLNFLSESIAEELYDKVCDWLVARFKADSDEKILVVVDSIGNVLSKLDAERSLANTSARPGGKGKTNREGLNKLIALRSKGDMALLLISYTYDNIGSPGKTNAGGKAVNFFSSLTYQTSRKQWLEKTVGGKKVRIGARVQWKLFKNHIDKPNPGPKVVELDITARGIEFVGGKEDESTEESDSSSDQ